MLTIVRTIWLYGPCGQVLWHVSCHFVSIEKHEVFEKHLKNSQKNKQSSTVCLQKIFHMIWYRNILLLNLYILWFPNVWSNSYFQNRGKTSRLFYISNIQPYTTKTFIQAKASDVTEVCGVWVQTGFLFTAPITLKHKVGVRVCWPRKFLKMLCAIWLILATY